MKAVSRTDVGTIREINQDYVTSYIKDDHHALFILCDGMGGHLAGDVASKQAATLLVEKYKSIDLPKDMIEDWLVSSIKDIDESITRLGYTNSEYEGMGTTIVVAYVDEEDVYIANVGDSRAYVYDDSSLTQISIDHTLVNALLLNGSLTQEQADSHPQRNILIQAIGGGSELSVYVKAIKATDGKLLLCSDGLYNALNNEEILHILNNDMNFEGKGEELINQANAHRSNDNISVILIDLGE